MTADADRALLSQRCDEHGPTPLGKLKVRCTWINGVTAKSACGLVLNSNQAISYGRALADIVCADVRVFVKAPGEEVYDLLVTLDASGHVHENFYASHARTGGVAG